MPIMKTRRRSPFNLPSAWTSGMVLPENVIDEGLERRGLVTQWAPRGTFDNPAVGTGGYVVPEYVQREGYGRGTFVTKWSPRGSYFGPGLPDWLNYPVAAVQSVKSLGPNKTEYVMESLHGTDQTALQQYGERAAMILISSVKRLPAAQRPAALRAQMNKLDKSLWSRTAAIATSLQKQGWAPADALQQGLSRAMSAGLAAEVIKAGARAQRGQRTAIGYLSGLGADAPPSSAKTKTSSASTTATFVGSSPECYNPPPGYTWVAATGTTVGHWERVRVGQTAAKAPDGCYTINGTRVSGGITGAVATQAPKSGPMVQCGPWLFPADVDSYVMGTGVRDHRGTVKTPWGALPASWQQTISDQIFELVKKNPMGWARIPHGADVVPAAALGLSPSSIRPLWGAIRSLPMFKDVPGVITAKQTGWIPLRLFPVRDGSTNLTPIPLFRTMHPTKNVEYGVYLRAAGAGTLGLEYPPVPGAAGFGNVWSGVPGTPIQTSVPRANGPLVFEWRRIPPAEDPGFWNTVFGAIMFIPSVLVNVVETIGEALEDAACAVLTSTAGQAAVTAAGTAAAGGAGAVAGAVGGQVAANAIGCKATEQVPLVIPSPPNSYLVPLAIAGAAVGAAYLMTRRK